MRPVTHFKRGGYLIWTMLLLIPLCFTSLATATNRTVNLVVAYKTVHFAGKAVRAIAVNNQIPAPTLHFKQGDHVTINVYNHLDQGTAIHWHGLIVPWKMDGVANVSQKPIPPGGVFHYQFTLNQSGTYWYHAHNDLQEQQGLYGAIIIDPPDQSLHYNRDAVIVLSDWSNTPPNHIYANLKKEGDFYVAKMPIQASLAQFIRDYHHASTPKVKRQVIDNYHMMQYMRMSIYDMSDIAYDAFLLNGQPASSPWTAQVNVGNTVRLRFIGAAASTIFQVKIPHTIMTMVNVDGNAVRPYPVKQFTIAPGETYDVLVTITQNRPYIIYAESIDNSGAAYGVLHTQAHQTVNYRAITPFPPPTPVNMMHHTMHHTDSKSASPTTGHAGHAQQAMQQHGAKPSSPAIQSLPTVSLKTAYDAIISPTPTNQPNQPVHIIRMVLTGYMDRYIWFLNGVPEYQAKPIMLKKGERYRIIFTNQTMMNHPMHIHGHWFILRNGHGAYDPLLHTINVPPNATIVADINANETGQWYFHCHNLYHMKAGMANIFRYQAIPQAAVENLSGHKTVGWYHASEVDINGDVIHDVYRGSLETFIGSDYNKLQLYSEEAEINDGRMETADIDLFYWRLIHQFWAIKGGLNYVYRPAGTPYFQPGIGIEGLMPYFIKLDVRGYTHRGSQKIDIQLSRDTHLTNPLFFRLAFRAIAATKTVDEDEIGQGLNELEWTVQPYYRLNSNLTIYVQYQHTEHYAELRRLLREEGEAVREDTFSIGASLLF